MKKNKKYPAYKDSGIEWIGEIPEHWEVRKLKRLGFIYSGLSGKSSIDFDTEKIGHANKPYIPFTNIYNNIIIDVSKYDYVNISRNEKQNKVKNKDLLFLMSSETYEDIAKSAIYLGCDEELYLNSFCKGFRFVKRDLVNPAFVNYLLKASIYRIYFESTARGFTRINIRQSYIKDTSIILPPLSEQKKIASFLDKKTAEIDKAIELKQKENELLKERRQVAINRAVTRGLNPNVTYKDSGVEWIGEIPEHWEVRKIKHLGEIKNGATPLSSIASFWDGNIVWVTPADIDGEMYTSIAKRNITYKGYKSCGTNLIAKGSIILTTRAPVGKVTIADISLCTNQGCKSICVANNFLSEYLYYYLSIQKSILESLASGTTFLELSTRMLASFKIPLPPLSEQKEIAEYLEELDEKTNRLLDLNNRAIDKLKEYKQVLIDQAVRGQICLV